MKIGDKVIVTIPGPTIVKDMPAEVDDIIRSAFDKNEIVAVYVTFHKGGTSCEMDPEYVRPA